MFEGYLCVGGLEIGNNSRARGYAETADCPVSWFVDDQCEGLADAVGDGEGYTLERISEAPWYDPDDESTHRFYGVYVTSLGEVSSSTRVGSFTEGITEGGIPGRSRHAGKTFRVRAWLTAAGEDALETGMSWLNAALEANTCGTHTGGTCGATDATFFTACPPVRAFVPDFSPWVEQYHNFVKTPSFENAGAEFTLFENLVTNPNLLGSTGGTVTVPEQVIYTNPLTGASATGWNATLVAAAGSGATGASATVTGSSPSSVVRVSSTGATTSVNPTASVRATYSLTTVVGVQYKLDYSLKSVSNACIARVSLGTAQGPEVTSNVLAAQPQLTFVATATTTLITVDVYDNPAQTGTRDNVYADFGGITVTQAAYNTTALAQVTVRRNNALNPRGAVSTNYDEYQPRYSWPRTNVGPTTAPFPGGPTTALRITCTAAGTGAGRGFDIGGNSDVANPGTSGAWINYPVTPGVPVTVSAWVRSNRTVANTRMYVRTHNGAGAWVGASVPGASGTMNGGVWTLFTLTITPAAGAAYLTARVDLGSVAWAVDDVIDQTAVYIGLPGDYFDGTGLQRTPDADLTASWVGTANASASLLTGVPVAGISTNLCVAVRSAKFGGSMRLIPTSATDNNSYAELSPAPGKLGQQTLMGTVSIEAPLTGSLHGARMRLQSATPLTDAGSPPNVAGSYPQRWVATPTSQGRMLFRHGGLLGSGDVYWTQPALVLGNYPGPWFAGDHPYVDDDFTTSWSGAADASTSVVKAIAPAGVTMGAGIAVWSKRWAKYGTHSLRMLGSARTGANVQAILNISTTVGQSAVATAHLEELYDESLGMYYPSLTDALSVADQVPNVIGDHELAIVSQAGSPFIAITGTNVDVWYDGFGIFDVGYTGGYFDGDTADTELERYAWDGVAGNSTSRVDTRNAITRPQTDEEYEADVTPLVRHMHDVICISGPLEIQTRRSRDNVHWGRLVEFTLYAGKPWLYGETKQIALAPTPATVIQDVPYNLLPSPSAEVAGAPMIAATNYSLNPSLEVNETGWAGDIGNVSGDVPDSRFTKGRVVGELAAAGTASMRGRLLGDATTASGQAVIFLSQMVDVSARPAGARVSATVWGAMLNLGAVAGTTLIRLRAFADWYDAGGLVVGSVTLGALTDASRFGGAVFSQRSMLPPPTATKLLVAVHGEFQWSSGTNKSDVRVYMDALGVTVP